MKKWIKSNKQVPNYIENTSISKDVIIFVKNGFKKIVHVGYYKENKWYNLSGNEINVIKWMNFPK